MKKLLLFLTIFFVVCMSLWGLKHPAQVKMYFLLLFYLIIYFIPTFVSIKANHKYTLQIFILNLFLGLSIIGWVGALIWATINNKTDNDNKITKIALISVFAIYTFSYAGGFIFYNCGYPIIQEKNNKIFEQNRKKLKDELKLTLEDTKKHIKTLNNATQYPKNEIEKSITFMQDNYPNQFELIKIDLTYDGYISNSTIEEMADSLLQKEEDFLMAQRNILEADIMRQQKITSIIDPLGLTISK